MTICSSSSIVLTGFQRWRDRHFEIICRIDLQLHYLHSNVTCSELLGGEDVRCLRLLNQVFCDKACFQHGKGVRTVCSWYTAAWHAPVCRCEHKLSIATQVLPRLSRVQDAHKEVTDLHIWWRRPRSRGWWSWKRFFLVFLSCIASPDKCFESSMDYITERVFTK